MSSKKPAATRQRTTALSAAIAGGALEDRDDDVIAGPIDSEGRAGPSATDNPLFDATLISAIKSLAGQQEQQQQQQQEQEGHNRQIFRLLEKLSDKVDLLAAENEKRNADEGEEDSVPHQSDDGETGTAGAQRDDDDESESSDEEGVGEQRFVDHTYYRHKIGEGFAQRQPSVLAPSMPAYFNIDDQVARSLADSKFAAKRQEYSITVANAFFAAITHEAQKDAIAAFEAGDFKTAHKLFKQVAGNLGAAADMQGDRMLFLNINSDPGATAKQKSFANDILRNEFTPGVSDRGGSSRTQKKFQLYEEQCLKATLGASAKAQANKHLSTGAYGRDGAGQFSDTPKKRPDPPKRTDGPKKITNPKDRKAAPTKDKKSEGAALKDKKGGKETSKKKVHFDNSDSDSD